MTIDSKRITEWVCRQRLVRYIKRVAPWFKVEEIHCFIA